MEGLFISPRRAVRILPLLLPVVAVLTGCQTAQQVTVRRLINHQAMLDFSGLKAAEAFAPVKAEAAAPETWAMLSLKKTALFTDVQWRSPSGRSGVGVAYVRMPLPLSSRMLLWFAKRQYSDKGDGGRMVSEWKDPLGRDWFEGENDKYHVRGYVLTRGFDAWIIYCGYKREMPPEPSELSLAARCMETIVPVGK